MKFVAIANADSDCGIVDAATARAQAQVLANEEGKPVTLRDPTSDKVIGTVKPKAAKAAGRFSFRQSTARTSPPESAVHAVEDDAHHQERERD